MRLLRKKSFIKFIAALLITVTVSGFMGPLKAEAKGSWIQNDAYGNYYTQAQQNFADNDLHDEIEEADLSDEDAWVLRLIGSAIWGLGHFVTKALSVDNSMIFSIEGIVLGRVANEDSGQIFSFRLDAGNFYGNVGASIYAIFRSVCTSGLLIVFLFFLAKAMFSTSSKAKDELKNNIYATLIAFMMMFLLPHLVELGIFLRDTVVGRIYGMGVAGRTSIFEELEASYSGNEFICGILYCAYAGAVIFYMKDYIMLALEETFLFGMFPLFNMLGTGKKKFMSDWASTFIADLMMPVTDIICLLMPFMMTRYISEAIVADGTNRQTARMAYEIALILMIWGARTVRQQIQKLYGGITGSQAGQGLRGLSNLASLARAGIRQGAGVVANAAGGGSNSNSETFNSAGEQATQAAESSAQSAQNAGDVNTSGLMSVDDIMAGKSEEEARDNSVDELLARMKSDDIDDEAMAENEWAADEARLSNLEEMDKANDVISGLEAENLQYDNELANLNAIPESDEMNALNEEMASIDNQMAENNMLNAADREILADEKANDSNALSSYNVDTANNDLENMQDRAAFAERNADAINEIGKIDTRNAQIDKEISDIERQRDNDFELAQSKKDISEYKGNPMYEAQYNAAVENRDRINSGYNSSIEALESEKTSNMARRASINADIASLRGDTEKQIANRNSDNAAIRQASALETATRRANTSTSERIQAREFENSKLMQRKTELIHQMNDLKTSERDSLNAEKARITEAKNSNKEKIEILKNQINERKKVEENLARAVTDARGTNQTFTSADAFRTDINVRRRREDAVIQAVKNKAMSISANDMKNFSASTRAQIAEARREQIRKENIRKIAKQAATTVTKKSAVTVARVAGGAMFAFGGEEASMTGAQLAGYGAENIANVTGTVLSGAYNNREEIKADVVAAGRGISNAGRAVANRVRRVQRTPQPSNISPQSSNNNTAPQEMSAAEQVYRNTQNGMRNH